jgi:fructan beta-fructosidase
VASRPSPEFKTLQTAGIKRTNISVKANEQKQPFPGKFGLPGSIDLSAMANQDFELQVANDQGEELRIGYDASLKEFYIDRGKAGISNFNKEFAARHSAPRIAQSGEIKMTLIFDVTSVELFADDGLTVMTSIFFPVQKYDRLTVHSRNGTRLLNIEYKQIKPAPVK